MNQSDNPWLTGCESEWESPDWRLTKQSDNLQIARLWIGVRIFMLIARLLIRGRMFGLPGLESEWESPDCRVSIKWESKDNKVSESCWESLVIYSHKVIIMKGLKIIKDEWFNYNTDVLYDQDSAANFIPLMRNINIISVCWTVGCY